MGEWEGGGRGAGCLGCGGVRGGRGGFSFAIVVMWRGRDGGGSQAQSGYGRISFCNSCSAARSSCTSWILLQILCRRKSDTTATRVGQGRRAFGVRRWGGGG